MVTSIPFLIARVTDDHDFFRLRELANSQEGWRVEYDKSNIKIWSRPVADVTIKMFKVWANFSGITSTDLYNALMDPIYRKQWDSHMIVLYDIGYLNPNNSICYYAAHCPPPLKSRDFVLQSSWLDMRTEHFMLNHSVCHKDHPPRPGFIRAISYFTGYYIKEVIDDGCEMTFVSQTDPQGIIPAWIVNKCTQIFAPRFIKQVEKAAYAYRAWKSQNNPDYYPWVHPDQMKAPKISVADCVPSPEERQTPFYKYLLQKTCKLQEENAAKSSKEETAHNTPEAGPSKFGDWDQKVHHSTSPGVHVSENEEEKKKKQKKSKTSFWMDFTKICFWRKSEA